MQPSSFLRNMCKKILQGDSALRPPKQGNAITWYPREDCGAHYFRNYAIPENEDRTAREKEKPRANGALNKEKR